MTMCLGFDFYLDETPLLVEVALEMRRRYNVDIRGVSLGKRWNKLLQAKGLATTNLGDFLGTYWDEFDTSEAGLAALETEYGTPWLSNVIHSDKYFVRSIHPRRYTYEYILKMLVGHFRFWEEYFSQHSVDAFVAPGLQALFDVTRMRVSQKLGIPNLNMQRTRLPNLRFALCRDERDQFGRVVAHLEDLGKRELTPQERQTAERFLNTFRQTSMTPSVQKLSWLKPSVRMPFVREFFVRLKRWYLEGWGRGTDYITPNPFWSVYRRGLRIIAKRAWTKLTSPFEMPREGERFVFFPLHFYPEAATLLRAPYYVNQMAVVEGIAKSIPITHRLYVKEHRVSVGHRPPSFYRSIKSSPNVRLISPDVHSHKLIRRADVIVVLTGTVGLEAMYYEKPVITMGDTFYNASGLTYPVPKIIDLPDAIRTALESYQPDRERLLRFIVALFEGSHPGRPEVPHYDPQAMSVENIQNMAEGLFLDLTTT